MKVNIFLCENFEKAYPIGTYAPFRSCGDVNKPDSVVVVDDIMFIVETDEHNHEDYQISCEWAKALQHGQSGIQTDKIKRVCFLRFNPDVWKVQDVTQTYPFKDRLQDLKNLMETVVAEQTELYTLYHLFYPCNDGSEKIVKVTEEELNHWMEILSE